MPDWMLSLLMLAGFALTAGGLYKIVKLHDRKQGLLMMGAGIVMFGNVAIWMIPI